MSRSNPSCGSSSPTRWRRGDDAEREDCEHGEDRQRRRLRAFGRAAAARPARAPASGAHPGRGAGWRPSAARMQGTRAAGCGRSSRLVHAGIRIAPLDGQEAANHGDDRARNARRARARSASAPASGSHSITRATQKCSRSDAAGSRGSAHQLLASGLWIRRQEVADAARQPDRLLLGGAAECPRPRYFQSASVGRAGASPSSERQDRTPARNQEQERGARRGRWRSTA